jgi:hypothetical protein
MGVRVFRFPGYDWDEEDGPWRADPRTGGRGRQGGKDGGLGLAPGLEVASEDESEDSEDFGEESVEPKAVVSAA